MSSEVIEFKGESIIYVDYGSYSDHQQTLTAFEEAIAFMESSDCQLALANYENAFVGLEYVNMARSNLSLFNDFKMAIYGLDDMKKVILNGYNRLAGRKLRAFESKSEALEYLIEK